MPGPASGSTTVISTRGGRAPSVRAAAIRFGSIAPSATLTERTTSGSEPTAAAITAPVNENTMVEPVSPSTPAPARSSYRP